MDIDLGPRSSERPAVSGKTLCTRGNITTLKLLPTNGDTKNNPQVELFLATRLTRR